MEVASNVLEGQRSDGRRGLAIVAQNRRKSNQLAQNRRSTLPISGSAVTVKEQALNSHAILPTIVL